MFTFKKAVPILCLSSLLSLLSCNNNPSFYSESDSFDAEPSIVLNNKFNGEELNLLDDIVNNYLELSNESEIARYLDNTRGNNNCETKGINISFESINCVENYALEIANDNSFNNLVKTINCGKNTSQTIYNLIPGTYYYRIKNSENIVSDVDCFKISNELRTINSSGGVKNIRDLGGFKTYTGDYMNYGLLYRSALPSVQDLSLFYWDLNIKTELDLRMKGGDINDIGDFTGVSQTLVNYVVALPIGARYYPQYDYIFQSQYKDLTVAYFNSIFSLLSDRSNYPLLFHCKSGADRTGTLAYIINGLCGVSFEELTKDYELTTYYLSPRFRSEIIDDVDGYHFSENGVFDYSNHYCWNLFHKEMMETYSNGGSLQQAIFNYLISYANVDELVIKQALDNLLTGTNYLQLFTEGE